MKRNKPNTFRPNPDDIRKAFQNSMPYEILYTFGVPHDLNRTDYFLWEVVNYSRLAHARLLADFLETAPDDRSQDDVLAADFGFTPQTTLTEVRRKERKDRLNKDLLHFSYLRLRHTPEEKKWLSSILGSLLDPTLAFMKLVRSKQEVGSSRVDLQACKLEYSIVSPK